MKDTSDMFNVKDWSLVFFFQFMFRLTLVSFSLIKQLYLTGNFFQIHQPHEQFKINGKIKCLQCFHKPNRLGGGDKGIFFSLI